MKKQIEYIRKTLDRLNDNVSIYCGNLSDKQLKELRKYFDVEKKYFGYYHFKRLNN